MTTIPQMSDGEQVQARKWVDAWRRAGPELERMRREDIRRADTACSIPAFDGLFELAVRECPPKPTSGLVEQQNCFRRVRR